MPRKGCLKPLCCFHLHEERGALRNVLHGRTPWLDQVAHEQAGTGTELINDKPPELRGSALSFSCTHTHPQCFSFKCANIYLLIDLITLSVDKYVLQKETQSLKQAAEPLPNSSVSLILLLVQSAKSRASVICVNLCFLREKQKLENVDEDKKL